MAKKQTLNLAMKGLYTHADTLSEVPEGALSAAENIVIDREGIAGSRRGYDLYNNIQTFAGGFKQLFHYRDRIFAHTNDGTTSGELFYDDAAGNWVSLGSMLPPDPLSEQAGFKIRGAEANRNVYITTNVGIQKLDTPTGPILFAGMPKGLGGDALPTGTTGYLPDDRNVAYRVVWGIKDANLNLILGAPSQRIIGTNTTGGSRNMELFFSIPDGITTNHFYQVYRSNPSAAALSEPDDEMQLVYENNPTTNQILLQVISFTDNLPESLKRATLYTSQSQEGIAQSNEPPPYAKDMTVYKNHTFYGNTKQKQRLTLTMIAVGVPGGSPLIDENFQPGDTITIAGTIYTGILGSPANNEFIVNFTGTPAENIALTVRDLIRAINESSTNTEVYAYYLSGYEDLPGKFLLEERGLGGDTFYASSSDGDSFDPILPAEGSPQDTSVASDNEEKQHRVYFSKIQQPEAVPLLNYFDIGSADEPVQRIIALRESVYIFKPDGIFRIVGETSVNFRVITADATSAIQAPECAITHNNQIMLWTEQGINSVSENGDVAILSRPIERDLLTIATYSAFQTGAFALSYESDRKYIVYVPETNNEGADVCCGYVYNSLTTSWTKWGIGGFSENVVGSPLVTGKYTHVDRFSMGCGFVDPETDLIVMGTKPDASITSSTALIEKKNWDLFDFADTMIGVSIYSIPSATTIVLTTYLGPNVGDINSDLRGMTLQQNDSNSKEITGNSDQFIDGEFRTVLTVTDSQSISPSPGSPVAVDGAIYNPITTTVQWIPNHCGNPGMLKHFSEITMFFDTLLFDNVDVSFLTNFVTETVSTSLTPAFLLTFGVQSVWGQGGWGEEAWGSTAPEQITSRQEALRTYVAREAARAHWLSVKVVNNDALSEFALTGVSIVYTDMSSKFQGVDNNG